MTSYEQYKKELDHLISTDYKAFVKALISIETDIVDEKLLDKAFELYMSNDNQTLISEAFYKDLERQQALEATQTEEREQKNFHQKDQMNRDMGMY